MLPPFRKHPVRVVLAFFLGFPIVACCAMLLWFVSDCSAAPFPQTYPGTARTITQTRQGAGSGGSWLRTTNVYTVSATRVQVQAFYTQQLYFHCQPETRELFQPSSPSSAIAKCSLKGWVYVSPEEREYARTYPESQEAFDLIYRESHKTVQTFEVVVQELAPTITRVEFEEYFNDGC